ncbi:hypothetical protein H5410_061728, partial [Solanum commersonii]
IELVQYFDEAPNEEARYFYDQLEKSTPYPLRRDKVDWWVVIKSKPVGRIEIDNVLDVPYQNDVAIVQQEVDVELETTLQHPQHILEEVSDDEILNVEEEIFENEKMNHLMMNNGTIMKMKQLRRKNGGMMELKQARRNSDDNNRHREHLGVSQTKQTKQKKSRRPIDPEDIAGSISSVPESISHDTHLFVVLFVSVFSTSPALPLRLYKDLCLKTIRRERTLSAGTPSPTDDTMPPLAPGQKDRLGRVMIEPDGSSWHPAKEAA